MTQLNPDNPVDTSRRLFIQGLTALFGSSITGSLLAAEGVEHAISYAMGKPHPGRIDKLFNPKEMQILRLICAAVIPAGDTPGAAEVDCHGFIDNQLYHCFDKAVQQQVKRQLKMINVAARRRHKRPMTQLDEQQHLSLLTDLEMANNGFNQSQREQFKFLKTLIVFGYYTSEVGASNELTYLALPGGYQGSVPLEQAPRNWGSIAYY